MDKGVKKRVKVASWEPKRSKRMVCYMSSDEVRIVERYLARYKISNRGRWMRETMLSCICKAMEEDYPTLFNEHEMRR